MTTRLWYINRLEIVVGMGSQHKTIMSRRGSTAPPWVFPFTTKMMYALNYCEYTQCITHVVSGTVISIDETFEPKTWREWRKLTFWGALQFGLHIALRVTVVELEEIKRTVRTYGIDCFKNPLIFRSLNTWFLYGLYYITRSLCTSINKTDYKV